MEYLLLEIKSILLQMGKFEVELDIFKGKGGLDESQSSKCSFII